MQWPLQASHRSGLCIPPDATAHLQLTDHTQCVLVLPDGSEHARPLSSSTQGVSVGDEWAPLCEAMNLASGHTLSMRAELGTTPLRLHLSVTGQSLETASPFRSRPNGAAGMEGSCVTWPLQRAVDEVADAVHIPPPAMARPAIQASKNVEVLGPGHEGQPLGPTLATGRRGHGELRMPQRDRSRAGPAAGRVACVRAESGGDTPLLHISGTDAPEPVTPGHAPFRSHPLLCAVKLPHIRLTTSPSLLQMRPQHISERQTCVCSASSASC